MAGRNNRPKNDGPAATPSRLDQSGEKQSQIDKKELIEKTHYNGC